MASLTRISTPLSIINENQCLAAIYATALGKFKDLFALLQGLGSCVKQIKRVAIFNRWGGQILTQNNITVLSDQAIDIWDGLVNGKPLDTGIFAYVIEAEYVNGEVAILGGDFSIVK
jgi:uncharacterized iron-regulated protein